MSLPRPDRPVHPWLNRHAPWWRLVQAKRVLARPHPPLERPWLGTARTVGAWVASSTAIGLILLLIIAVEDRGLVRDLPHWMRRSLEPDAWWTILTLVTVSTVAAILYWRSRRRTDASLGYLAGACLTVATIALALPTYANCSGDQADVWTSLTWTLSLFVGSVQDPFGSGNNSCPGEMPLALQVARFTGIMTTFISLVALALTALSAQRDRLRVRLSRSVILVVGLDQQTRRFVETLVEQSRGSTVVLLEADHTNTLVGDIRAAGVRVVFGSVEDPEQIKKLVIRSGLLGRRSVLAAAYVLSHESSDAVTVSTAILKVCETPRSDGTFARLVTRIDDPREAEAWRRQHVSDQIGVLTDTAGLYRVTAEAVVDRALEEGVRELVLVGSSPMAVAILEELVQHRREQAVSKVVPELSVVVIAEDADLFLEDHIRSQEWYGDHVRDSELPVAIVEPPSVRSVASSLDSSVSPCIVVTVPPSPEQDKLVSRIALRHPNVPCLVWRDSIQGIATSRILGNVTAFGLTLVARRTTSRGTFHSIPEDGWQRVARRLHEQYLAGRGDADQSAPSRQDWDDLSPFYRESNLRRVAAALQIVMLAGRTWLPPTVGARVPMRLSDDEIRDWARVEHESWCSYYRAHGWRRGPKRESAHLPLRHPALVDWEHLGAEDREYTIGSVAQCLEYLEAMGYVPFDARTRSAGGRFRRTGRVTAQRRFEDWTWDTDTGATMSAQAGDWEISDEKGAVWSITDADFRRTYELVEGDTYERTGRVAARKTVSGEQVISTEGIEEAKPGDWLVEDDAGKQWIVPAERFQQAYRQDDNS